MAKDVVEIHNPIPNHSNLTTNTDCDHDSTSDTDSMEDTVEYKLLRAYAQRRRPKKDRESSENNLIAETEPLAPQAPAKTEEEEEGVKEEKNEKEKKKRRTKKASKRLQKIFSCLRPKTQDDDVLEPPPHKPDPYNRCGDFIARVAHHSEDVTEKEKLDEVVGRLTEIADDVPFIPSELESDSADDVEKVIGLLLREAGDKLNDEELNGAAIVKELFWNYSFFEKIINGLLTRMGLMHSDNLGPQASPKTQIAVTCEATSRLSALDTQPMNRMLSYGARYLQNHHTSWAKQQGGYEEAFHSDEEDDNDDVQ